MSVFINLTTCTIKKEMIFATVERGFDMRVSVSTIRSYRSMASDLATFRFTEDVKIPSVMVISGDRYTVLHSPEEIDGMIEQAKELELTQVRAILSQLKYELKNQ